MISKLVDLIFEALHLKQVKHEGVRLMGVRDPESVAEHSLNAAQIGYIIAKMEGADAYKVATILIWHDIAETRMGDIHKVGARYLDNKKEAEVRVMKEQMEDLDFGEDILSLFDEYEHRTSLEWMIAKDADYLEQAFQMKVYLDQWYPAAQDWIENVGQVLQTESAKKLWAKMQEKNSTDRWREHDLKKLEV